MIKKSLFAIFSVIIVLTAHAQNLQMGLRFNPEFIWFNATNNENINYMKSGGLRMGFSYGLQGDYFVTPNYSFSTGIFHNIFKAKTEPLQNDTFQFNKWDMQYIQIPLLIKMTTNEIGNFEYYGKFGITPYINILNTVDKVALHNVKIFNFFLTIGGGAQYIIGGTTSALLGISFHNGFSKVNKEKEFTLKAASFSIDMGVLF